MLTNLDKKLSLNQRKIIYQT